MEKANRWMDEMSFCELKCKEIVNELDGRKLGRATDLVFSPSKGCILGIVAPFYRRTFFFGKSEMVYIPFKNIIKIGPDVILVKLTPQLSRAEFCYDIQHDDKHDKDKHDKDKHDNDRHDRRDKRDDCCPPRRDRCDDDHKKHEEKKDCDNRCEKCMLFDCGHRWKSYC